MTATDVLRRMLDERGVEHETDDTQVSDTEWYYVTKLRDGCHDRWTYEEPPDCDLLVSYQYDLGAEDAIAATLGATDANPTQAESSGTFHPISCNCSDNCTNGERTGTCHVESSIIDTYEYNRWEYELSCGHTIIWEDSEPPNFCPNCGRKVVYE